MATKIQSGSSTAGLANVTADYALQTTLERNADTNPTNVSAIKTYSVNDEGTITGTPYLASPEVDDDYRLRTTQGVVLDSETFNYIAQSTGKHQYSTTTMTMGWSTGGLNSNSGNSVASGAASWFRTYSRFPLIGQSALYCEIEGSLSAAIQANTVIDCGLFYASASSPYPPTDGVYFRINASGFQGVINYNGAETSTGTFTFTHTPNHKYQFIISITEREIEFWIDNVLYGSIETPVGQGQPFLNATVPFALRHTNSGTVPSAISFVLNDYTVSLEGSGLTKSAGDFGNSVYGSYQGLSGWTQGGLASYANNTNPTPAVPTNTTSAVLTALGGQAWETDTLAVNTDGIIMAYQIPSGVANERKLKLNGIKIDSYVQTGLTGGGYVAQYALCFGHIAVALTSTEAVATKAPRRIPIGIQSVASGAVALTKLDTVTLTLQNPVYINAGEFIAIAKKKVGTAPSAGVIGHLISLDYSWE